MDRRADPRVEVRLPCHVEFPGSKSSVFVGVTTNMSRSGILVAWNAAGLVGRLPKPGDPINVDVELPANPAFGRRCMHCQAVVTRVSPGDCGLPMVAVQVGQMQFRSYSEGSRDRVVSEMEANCPVM